MVATKMFLDMWRNLTNATSNWTISSSTSSSSSWSSTSSSTSSRNKWSRYNRLRSQPTKSYSQPANLTGLTTALETTSSLESLDDDGQQRMGNHKEEEIINEGRAATFATTAILKKKGTQGKQETIKHSFTTASFLPFSSFRAGGNGISQTKDSKQSTQARIGKENVGSIPNGSTGPEKNITLPNSVTATANSQKEIRQQKEEFCVVEHVISDPDEDDDDDGYHLACDVCNRAFSTFKDLADHQRKKRHYGCVQCDTLFPNREGLDIHREQMCHYEFAIDLAGYRDYGQDEQDDSDSFVTDDDENGFGYSDDGDDEEMERLL